jgi:hypothetical protein
MVPDGTILNLGVVDTILASGSGDAATNGNSLSGTFNLFGRPVAANDRVLIMNAAQVDRNRFVSTGTTSPFIVAKNYNNVVAGALNAYIGAAIQGGYVSGSTGEIGWTATTGGIAPLDVTYPKALTTFNAGAGYGCAGLLGSEGVFVVVSSSDGGVTTINQGGFCFAP